MPAIQYLPISFFPALTNHVSRIRQSTSYQLKTDSSTQFFQPLLYAAVRFNYVEFGISSSFAWIKL